MKTRLFIVLLVVIVLLAAMSLAAAAQAPSGDGRPGFAPAAVPELSGPNVAPELPFDPEAARPWGNPIAGLLAQPAAAMTVFNGRLGLGVTNWASGAGVWQKTLTADFTATPTRGAPPLTVQFASTSAGDFTTSQWDFGDGGTSTAISPTHTYTAAGTYTVTLTVGDGTDTSTITKAAYIVAKFSTYLPVVMRNYRPPNASTYDDFNNAAFDGLYNQERWSFSTNNTFRAQQQSGALVLTSISGPAWSCGRLMMTNPSQRNIGQVQQFEGRLKLSSDRTGGWAVVQIYTEADISGQRWYTQCFLGASNTSQPHVACQVCLGNTCEYSTTDRPISYDTWCKVRIEADPTTANLRFLS